MSSGKEKDQPSIAEMLSSLYLPWLAVKQTDPGKINEVQGLSDAAKLVLQKTWGFIKAIGKGIWQFFSFLIDVLTGDAINTWGMAPYLALPGLLLFPIFAMVPGVESLITAPFGFVGVTPAVLTYYQFISGIYYFIITLYNLYEGDKLQ